MSDDVPQPNDHESGHHKVRDLEMYINVEPNSRTIGLSIVNNSSETRFLRVPLDLTLFRIKLTAANGHPLKMTARGTKDFTEPAAGSVMKNVLKTGERWDTSIDLGKFFEFPPSGVIRCEVSRLVHFAEPRTHPYEREWINFPPVRIVLRDPALPPISPSTQPAVKQSTTTSK